MQITIESQEMIQKTSKAGKPYFVQQAYAHVVNSDGSPKRYPQEITIFTNRDAAGNSVAFLKGEYLLSDSSFTVERGFLTLNNVNMQKINNK